MCSEIIAAVLRCYATRACFKKTAVRRKGAKEVGIQEGLVLFPDPPQIEAKTFQREGLVT